MSPVEVFHASSVDGLDVIDSILHDARFRMSEVEFDQLSSTVRIPFERDLPDRRRWAGVTAAVPSTGQLWLHVGSARWAHTEDTNGINRHDLGGLRWDGSETLQIVSHMPGRVDVYVDELDVSLVVVDAT